MISKSHINLSKAIKEHQNIFSNLEKNIDIINSSINLIYKKIKKGGKIIFCGTGTLYIMCRTFLARYKGTFRRTTTLQGTLHVYVCHVCTGGECIDYESLSIFE